MNKIVAFVIILLLASYAFSQTCPGTLANQTTASEPFFKIDQGNTNCSDWPMTITIDGSVFEQTSCNGANLEYVLVSGPPLADPNNFVADFGFGECTYVNGTLSGQTLSTNELETTEIKIYPNPSEKRNGSVLSFGKKVSGTVSIYTINGLRIAQHAVHNVNTFHIETVSLKQGIYMVSVQVEDQKLTKKLVVY